MPSVRRLVVVAHDLLMVAAAWVAAHLLRYNLQPEPEAWRALLQALPVVLAVQGLVQWRLGLYRGLWRFASLPDLWNILRAAVLGIVLAALALFLINRLEGVPRSVLVLYPLLLVFLLGGPRLLYRLWRDRGFPVQRLDRGRRVLLLGAGKAGEQLVRDMLRQGEYLPVGLLDDERRLRGARVHGVPVLGTLDELPRVAVETGAELLVIAMPSATGEQMQRAVALCEATGLPFRTLPRMEDLMAGRVGVEALRRVGIEDLLGREPVTLDWEAVSESLAGRTVLVTGGAGSIGAELCRQVGRLGPAALVVLDQAENGLYEVERELRGLFPGLALHCRLGSVTDPAAVERLMARHRPQVVFHAAAYKHVPLLEAQPREAIVNNVLGTRIVAEAARRHRCESFVLISTDKAVNPANVLGATKRVAELICQAYGAQGDGTRFVTVRFGNVLGSAGSVVPLFRRQIEAGGPVTVTHPQVERFFMTIPEACQLILQAAAIGKGGEVFVLDMGRPVRIRDLAEQMIRLAGREPGRDIPIVYTGLRPGEKLREELFYATERHRDTCHEKILLAEAPPPDGRRLARALDALEAACREERDDEALRGLLRELVPELHEPDHPRVIPFPGPRR